jgi:hypothetical protein
MVGFSWWWCWKFAKNPRLPSGSSQIGEYGSCKHLTTYLIILKDFCYCCADSVEGLWGTGF